MSRTEPFPLKPMNNVFPATWEAISGGIHPEPYSPVLDSDSALRATLANDFVNYFVRQRTEGDLFKRDVILQQSLKALSDYLSSRRGLNFNIPSVSLAPDTCISLGSLTETTQILGYWVVGFSINVREPLTGWATNEIKIEVLNNTSNDILFSAILASRKTQVWTVSQNTIDGFRGPFLTGDLRFRLSNESGVRIAASASIILAPVMNVEADDTGDTDPGFLLLDDSVSSLLLDDGVSRLVLD